MITRIEDPLSGQANFTAECSNQLDCPHWDMTRWHDSAAAAADAWNAGKTISLEAPAGDVAGETQSTVLGGYEHEKETPPENVIPI